MSKKKCLCITAILCLAIFLCVSCHENSGAIEAGSQKNTDIEEDFDLRDKKLKYFFGVRGAMKGYHDAADSLYKNTLNNFFDENLNFLLGGVEYYWYGEYNKERPIGINKFEDRFHAVSTMLQGTGDNSIYTTNGQNIAKASDKNTHIMGGNDVDMPFNLLTEYVKEQWEDGDRSLYVITADMQERQNDFSAYQEIFRAANQLGKSFALFLVGSEYTGHLYNVYPGDVVAYYPLEVYDRYNYNRETGLFTGPTGDRGSNNGEIAIKYNGMKLFSILIFGEKEDVEIYYNLFSSELETLNNNPMPNPIGSEIFLYDNGVQLGNLNRFHLENFNSLRYNRKNPDVYNSEFNKDSHHSMGIGSANNFLRSAANAFARYYPAFAFDDLSGTDLSSIDLRERIPEVDWRRYYRIDGNVPFSRYVFAMPINHPEIGLESRNIILSYDLEEISPRDIRNNIPAVVIPLASQKIKENLIRPSGIKIIDTEMIEKNFINDNHATHVSHVEGQEYFYFSVELRNDEFGKYDEDCAYRLTIIFENIYEAPPPSSLKELVDKFSADYPYEIINDAAERVNIIRTMNLRRIYNFISEVHRGSLGSTFETELFFLSRKN